MPGRSAVPIATSVPVGRVRATSGPVQGAKGPCEKCPVRALAPLATAAKAIRPSDDQSSLSHGPRRLHGGYVAREPQVSWRRPCADRSSHQQHAGRPYRAKKPLTAAWTRPSPPAHTMTGRRRASNLPQQPRERRLRVRGPAARHSRVCPLRFASAPSVAAKSAVRTRFCPASAMRTTAAAPHSHALKWQGARGG